MSPKSRCASLKWLWFLWSWRGKSILPVIVDRVKGTSNGGVRPPAWVDFHPAPNDEESSRKQTLPLSLVRYVRLSPLAGAPSHTSPGLNGMAALWTSTACRPLTVQERSCLDAHSHSSSFGRFMTRSIAKRCFRKLAGYFWYTVAYLIAYSFLITWYLKFPAHSLPRIWLARILRATFCTLPLSLDCDFLGPVPLWTAEMMCLKVNN